MLEAQPVQRVVQFDIDAEIVGIELQGIARREAAILGDVEDEPCHRPVELHAPMAVAVGMRVVEDHGRLADIL